MRAYLLRRRGAAIAAVLLGGAITASAGGATADYPDVPPAPAPGCATAVDPAAFTSAARMRDWDRHMYELGERLTGSGPHKRYVSWLARKLRAIDGMRLRSTRFQIERWLERRSELTLSSPSGDSRLAVAGAVPYSARTGPDGAEGGLVYIPHGESIAGNDVAGKVVVRDSVPASVPNAAFALLQWTSYDPDGSLAAEAGGTYERDYLSYQDRVDDLHAAAAGGAAGIVFVLGFPNAQMRGHYEPYEGVRWGVPGVLVGAAAGEALKAAAADGGSARIRVSASVDQVGTRNLRATLPGASEQRIVVESHTDGINALQEDGGLGVLAIARHFGSLPRRCRPRTLEFELSTAHLHQVLVPGVRNGGAEQEAERLDRAYDDGGLAAVVAIEHLGARGYAAEPNPAGPGRTLVPTGESEPYAVFVSDSDELVGEVTDNVVSHELARTLILQGADLPGATIPPHQSFGGEGTPYNRHLLPTVGAIAGPWSLYNPAFGMEAVDARLMRRQTIFFADLVHTMMPASRTALAGAIPAMRTARDAVCAADPSGGGITLCK